MSQFYGGQTVVYKNNKYIIITTPETHKMKTPDGWIPAYLYVNMRGDSFSRTQSDMETKFLPAKG